MAHKNLFICDTPFQIMMALAFRMTILEEEQVDIVISNIITNSEKLYENIKVIGVFEHVYYYRDYELDYGIQTPNKIGRLKHIINRKKIVSELLQLVGVYDAFYATDTLPSIEWLYECLIRLNPKMDMYYFEEGPISVLCDQGNHFKSKNEYSVGKGKIVEKILGIKHINGHYTGAFVSVKDQMSKKYFEWYDMPMISKDRMEEYVDILNQIWDYKCNGDFINKVVFLEESFYTDGRENQDMEIVTDLIDFFGKERVIVKLHPRTREDRFEKIGIRTYKKTSVPWELIALNGGFEGAILVCVASGAVMYPSLYWGIKQNSIALVNCKDYYFKYLDDKYYRLFAKICSEKKLADIPENKQELYRLLTKYK